MSADFAVLCQSAPISMEHISVNPQTKIWLAPKIRILVQLLVTRLTWSSTKSRTTGVSSRSPACPPQNGLTMTWNSSGQPRLKGSYREWRKYHLIRSLYYSNQENNIVLTRSDLPILSDRSCRELNLLHHHHDRIIRLTFSISSILRTPMFGMI